MTSNHHNHNAPEPLYEEGNKVVMRCSDCGCVQFTFGTSHFLLTWDQFLLLDKKLERESVQIKYPELKCKCFSIPVENHVARLFLTSKELLELQLMIQQALWMFSVKEILNN